jgi:hypothetical protein
MPTSPQYIIEHRQPISKKDLSTIPIEKGKVYLREDQHNILIEVVAHHPADPPIPPPPMHQ